MCKELCVLRSVDKSVFIVLGIWFMFLFVLNLLLPAQSDDLGATFGGFDAAYYAFMNWNPRLGNLILVSYMAGLANMAFYFDFLNACVGTGFIFLIFFLIYGRIPRDFHDSVILIVIVFFFMLHAPFGDFFLWATSSCVYTWGYCILALVLIPYRLLLNTILLKLNKNTTMFAPHTQLDTSLHQVNTTTSFSFKYLFYSLGFFILTFLAGMCSQVGGIIIFLALVALACYTHFFKKTKLPSWYYIGMFGILLGWLVLYFAPGSIKRQELFIQMNLGFYSLKDLWKMSILEKLERISICFQSVMHDGIFNIIGLSVIIVIVERIKAGVSKIALLTPLAVVIGIIIVFVKFKFNFGGLGDVFYVPLILGFHYFFFRFYQKQKKEVLSRIFLKLFWLLILYYGLSLVLIQVRVPSRGLILYFLISMGIFLFLYQECICYLQATNKNIKRFQYAITIACCILGFYVLIAYTDGRIKWDTMVESIQEQKREGREDIVIDAKTFKRIYWHYGSWDGIGHDPHGWRNPFYAKYFGVKTILAK